jgi:hypothetical protein
MNGIKSCGKIKKIIHRFVPLQEEGDKKLFTDCLQSLQPRILQNIFILVVMKLIYWVTAKNAKQKLLKKAHLNYI